MWSRLLLRVIDLPFLFLTNIFVLSILRCLNKLPEMRCPLCRTEFDIDREAYRLRVDLTTEDIVDGSKLSTEDLQARYLENRLLHASEEGSSEELHQAAINDAESWLEGKPEHTVKLLLHV